MEDLIILGTGVHGAEMAQIVERVNALKPTWRLLGLIAPDDEAGVEECRGYPVLGAAAAISRFPDACFVPDNEFRGFPMPPRERLVSLVDPSSFVSHTARIGAGCVIYPNCFVGLNAALGDRVFVLSGCVINHDDYLEGGVVLCSNVTLAGGVHVEAGCYLGQSCTVRQLLRVGRGSLIGMGSVVVKDVPPDSMMAGNPARKLRDREEKVPPGAETRL